MNAPITLRTDAAMTSLARAALAKAYGTLNKASDSKLSKDRVADLIMRNVSVPTSMTEARAARDILIGARIMELRRLARRTAAGELPAPPDDPLEDGDRP
jgi:hypothetical protein